MQSNTMAISNKISFALTFTVMLGVGIIAPLFGNQFITGPIVNATLFLAVSLLGIRGALLIGMFPSVIALSTGILAPVLAPMIPFIIIGNALLVLVFDSLKSRNFWVGAVTGAVLKFVFLYATGSIVTNLLINQQISAKVALAMSWPQLVTALIGAILAYSILHTGKSFLRW